MKSRTIHQTVLLTALLGVMLAGCIIDDRGGSRGQSNAPAASVPDSGSPVRRESPTKTLKDAEPESSVNSDAGKTTVRGQDN